MDDIIILAFGEQPLDFLKKASALAGKDAVIDQDAARMAGAVIAVGSSKALDDLKKKLATSAKAAEKDKHPYLSEAAARWLASGKRGISSDTMFTTMTGIDAMGNWHQDHPYDPADFRRCRLLLEQVPELAPMLPKMAEVSPQWAELVRMWSKICAAMDEESPKWRAGGGRCPITYKLIKDAIGAE